VPKSHIKDQEEFKVKEILPEDLAKVRKEEYCSRCAGQKSALHSLSFAYESRELSRARGQENQTKPKIPSSVSPISMMDIDEMIKIISQAGYLVEKDLKEGCG
jgi:hypothetical protein